MLKPCKPRRVSVIKLSTQNIYFRINAHKILTLKISQYVAKGGLLRYREEEGNVLFNDALNIFYLQRPKTKWTNLQKNISLQWFSLNTEKKVFCFIVIFSCSYPTNIQACCSGHTFRVSGQFSYTIRSCWLLEKMCNRET